MKEHRPDGSIIAVLCSAVDFDSTDIAKGGTKGKKKKKAKESVSKDKDEVSVCRKEKVNDSNQNGVDNIHENLISEVKTKRKQARKRGKKKKNEDSEISTL